LGRNQLGPSFFLFLIDRRAIPQGFPAPACISRMRLRAAAPLETAKSWGNFTSTYGTEGKRMADFLSPNQGRVAGQRPALGTFNAKYSFQYLLFNTRSTGAFEGYAKERKGKP
jgi:hypothetical protein